MNRSVVVRKLPDFKGREIVISDIHGNLSLYLRLLQACGYRPGTDRLILLGDMIEKGDENLAVLRYIMKQTETENVWCLMGNCDFTLKNILFSYRMEFLRKVVSTRKSAVMEMAQELGLHLDEQTDMGEFCMALRKAYLRELCFVNDLPHVLVGENRIYTHAAIMNETTFGSDFRETMTTPFFMNTEASFSKTVVCGHLPVSEYCRKILDLTPVYDPARNIWSIDGGNVVKSWGQLNAVIFDKDTVSTVSLDDLPKARAVRDVDPGMQIPFCLTWNNGQVKVLEAGSVQSYVHSDYLNRDFWIDTAFLDHGKGCDYTNWQMPLTKGDVVSVAADTGDKVYIKKGGRLGWAWAADISFL